MAKPDDEKKVELFKLNENQLYFDKKHKKEEVPYEISEERQKHYELLETYYEMICPKQTLDESMTFRSFAYILEVINKEFGENSIEKGNFVDLGSGSGKGCIAAAFIHPFSRCTGFELLENIHQMAEKNKLKYDINFRKFLTKPEYQSLNLFPKHTKKPELSFYKRDFLEENWSNACFVFSNSTCYDNKTWEGIVDECQKLKKGAILVNTTKTLPKNICKNWISIPPFQRLMSWGVSTVFIHRKRF